MEKNQPTALRTNAGPTKNGADAYSFSKGGFPIIRKACILFGISLISGIALVSVSRAMLTQSQMYKEQAQTQRNGDREKYSQAELERAEIRDFLPKFELLRIEGFYGDEQRLNIIEAIKKIQETRKLLPISYEFAPQQLVAVDPSMLPSTLELRASRVAIHMRLLHELDLFYFLQDLKSKGLYTANECNIVRSPEVLDTGLTAQMKADCSIFWLTVAPPAAATPQAQ